MVIYNAKHNTTRRILSPFAAQQRLDGSLVLVESQVVEDFAISQVLDVFVFELLNLLASLAEFS